MYVSEGTAPQIVKHSIAGGKFSISRNGQFTFQERAPDTERLGSWADRTSGLDTAELKNLSFQESSAVYAMA
jgi:hypothetical protein